MKILNQKETSQVSGAGYNSEDFIEGAIGGTAGGLGLAGGYMGAAVLLGTNPAGWAVLGVIGVSAGIGGLYNMAFD